MRPYTGLRAKRSSKCAPALPVRTVQAQTTTTRLEGTVVGLADYLRMLTSDDGGLSLPEVSTAVNRK